MTEQLYELEARYDARKSFYGKATVGVSLDESVLYLYSYGTHVASVDVNNNSVELLPRWNESATTLRHVKEFLKQYGYKADTKAQIEKDYA